ncbi:hypothetical protein [Roseiconus lacunae]|uniref:Uncharacterized protein n=1 Tax=Roseiconus lacunae TaxID=2605694 RepID=A0ABT7PKZ8_9BACT|nr:hypothetical protein [Roseiconus lacunae]MDM4017166.1 hypothetical protein [Roseiconus lacunae]
MSIPNVAFLHCHFRRGGVTQVVENQVAALVRHGTANICLLSGGRNEGLSASTETHADVRRIEGLDYDSVMQTQAGGTLESDLLSRGLELAKLIHASLSGIGWVPDRSVLHWHNHSLGKNVAIPIAIGVLANRFGYRQVLQIHDFAEDFRPENYGRLIQAAMDAGYANPAGKTNEHELPGPASVNRFLFPVAASIRYATLTSGDATLLSQIGVEANSIDVLPNGVALDIHSMMGREEARKKLLSAAALPSEATWCVYPVRGIRRKNVGEFLLLSRLMPEGLYSGLTLPPTTPIELASYERWKAVADRFAPRAVFDAGIIPGVSFVDNLAACSFVLSTSAAEGFGMAFLEPWLARRGVVARRLSHVTDDFQRAGVDLDRLYDAVEIPGSAAWVTECLQESGEAYRNAWKPIRDRFGDQFVGASTSESDRAIATHHIDFARLIPKRQIEVLRRMDADKGFEDEIRAANPVLGRSISTPFADQQLERNHDQIGHAYSIEATAQRLVRVYQRFGDSSGSESFLHASHSDQSLATLINRSRPFFPCRVESEIA